MTVIKLVTTSILKKAKGLFFLSEVGTLFLAFYMTSKAESIINVLLLTMIVFIGPSLIELLLEVVLNSAGRMQESTMLLLVRLIIVIGGGILTPITGSILWSAIIEDGLITVMAAILLAICIGVPSKLLRLYWFYNDNMPAPNAPYALNAPIDGAIM
jgi:hypothetical protein